MVALLITNYSTSIRFGMITIRFVLNSVLNFTIRTALITRALAYSLDFYRLSKTDDPPTQIV